MGAGKRRLEPTPKNVMGRDSQSYQSVSRETLWYDYGVFNRPASPQNFDLCKGRFCLGGKPFAKFDERKLDRLRGKVGDDEG
jgi:hypothetical protein